MPRKEKPPGKSYLRVADDLFSKSESQEFLCLMSKSFQEIHILDWDVSDGTSYSEPNLLFQVFLPGGPPIRNIAENDKEPFESITRWLEGKCNNRAHDIKMLCWENLSTFNTKMEKVPLSAKFQKYLADTVEFQESQARLVTERDALLNKNRREIKKKLLDKDVARNSRRFAECLCNFRGHDVEHLDLYFKEFLTSLVIDE